jgi:hypothetical protein
MRHRHLAAATSLALSMLICPSVAGAGGPTPTGAAATGHADEAPFLTENAKAMKRMMAGMDVRPTGYVDVDFAAMMIPHHQGAIDMAIAYLRYGKNEQLRRIAQEIIVTQQQEIAAMRLALGEPLPPSAPAPDQPSPPPHDAMPSQMMHMHREP